MLYTRFGGSGAAIRVGDDTEIHDVNVANALGIKGVQNSGLGFIRFGSDTNQIGYDGTRLNYGGGFYLNGQLQVAGQIYSDLNSTNIVAPIVPRNLNNTNVTTKAVALSYAQGLDTVSTVKDVGYISVNPRDGNWVGSDMNFYTRTSDALGLDMTLGGDGMHYIYPADDGRFRSSKTRTNIGWNYAHFEAYTPTGSSVDFASFTAHIQDQSTAVQFGLYNNGTVTKSGVFDSAGGDLLIYNHTTGTAFANGVELGFREIPQNLQNATYTFALTDRGKSIGKDNTTAYTYTIPANGTVAFPVGSAITVFNGNATSNITIAINSDTLRLAGTTTTGSRTLAPWGVCTLLKISSTVWLASGSGLT